MRTIYSGHKFFIVGMIVQSSNHMQLGGSTQLSFDLGSEEKHGLS